MGVSLGWKMSPPKHSLCLLPGTASTPAASRLFGFDLSQTPIPDHFCSIPVTKNIEAEWKLLDMGQKISEMKII